MTEAVRTCETSVYSDVIIHHSDDGDSTHF
jgi:hypothetical protein